MSVNLSFIGGAGWQFLDDNGDPLSGGKIYTYAAGTTVPQTTYTSRSGLIANTNPIILDAAGRTPEQIWSTEGLLYKYVVKTSNDVIIRSWDNVGGSVVASDLAQDLANTTDNAKGDALVGFKQANTSGFLTGAVARTVNDKLQEVVSVLDFGADPTGTTVCTAQLQAAIDAVIAAGGGAIYIPAGTYLTRVLNITSNNVTIYGDGAVSLLKRDPSWIGTNHGIFVFENTAGDIENISISKIGIDFNGTGSFGFGIKLGETASLPATYNTSRNIRITDVRIKDSNPQVTTGDKWAIVFRGKLENVWIERCHSSDDMQLTASGVDTHKNVNILNNCCYDGRANGIAMSDPYNVDGLSIIGNYVEAKALGIFIGPDQIYTTITTGQWKDVVVANNRLVTKSTGSVSSWHGIYVNAAGNSYKNIAITGNVIDCKDTINSQHGIRFTDQTSYGTVIQNAAITGNVIENCRWGISIDAGGKSQISGNQVTNCTDGIYIAKAIQQVGIVGNNCFGGSRGINIVEGEVLVSGNTCQGGSGQTGSFVGRLNLAPGVGQTAKVFAIGNKFTDGLGAGGSNVFGVRYSSGTGTVEVQLIDNDLRGNTAGVSNLPANARVQNNLGWVTNNGGQTAAIATGTTVTHGCNGTPTIVQVTPLAGTPTDVTVTSINSANFTINFGGGGSHVFAWEAKTTEYYQ